MVLGFLSGLARGAAKLFGGGGGGNLLNGIGKVFTQIAPAVVDVASQAAKQFLPGSENLVDMAGNLVKGIASQVSGGGASDSKDETASQVTTASTSSVLPPQQPRPQPLPQQQFQYPYSNYPPQVAQTLPPQYPQPTFIPLAPTANTFSYPTPYRPLNPFATQGTRSPPPTTDLQSMSSYQSVVAPPTPQPQTFQVPTPLPPRDRFNPSSTMASSYSNQSGPRNRMIELNAPAPLTYRY
jgi:hypothetical protein